MFKNVQANPRRFMRFDAKSSDISGSICDRKDAVLRDISLGGACFNLAKPIEKNSSCRIEINDGGRKFHVSGRVAWSREPGQMKEVPENLDGMFTVGVVFLNTYNNESGAGLADLIDRLGS